MPQSLSFVLIHYIFSTKDRRPFITSETRASLHAYLATVVRKSGAECYRVGGTADHVHLAVRQSRTSDIASTVEEMKTASSKWYKTRSPELEDFAWQRGYAAFSVGPSDINKLCAYIDQQEERHTKLSFQDELRALLNKYGIEHDERYLWD